MKKIYNPILLSITFFLTSILQAQNINLVVSFKNKTETSFMLRDIKNLKFNSDFLLVNMFEGSVNKLQIPELQKIYLEKVTSTPNIIAGKCNIYPNPTTGIIFFSNLPEETNDLRIFNMSGIEILKTKVSNHTTSFDISSLKKGIYFIQLKNQTEKIIKL